MPARPSEAPMTLRNPRREALSSHSEAPLGNSRCKASWKAGLPASSSSERQYSGPVFSALSCAMAASIRSRTVPSSTFLVGQMSSSLTNCDLLSVVIAYCVVPTGLDGVFVSSPALPCRAFTCPATRLGSCRALLFCPDMHRFFRPFGACAFLRCYPPASAVGCILSPLRGFCSAAANGRLHRQHLKTLSSFARRTADGGCPHTNLYFRNRTTICD